MVEAVLFDLGDTLLDFDPLPRRELFHSAAEATYAHLKGKGCTLPSFEKYYSMHIATVRWAYVWSTLRGREIDSFATLQRWCRKNDYPSDDESVRELIWIWYQPVIPRSKVEPDVIPALRRLQSNGMKLALVSNTLLPGCVLDRHLELVGLREFFPVRIYSSEVGYRKPKPIIFHAAMDQMGLPPGCCAFVGDLVKTDIKGARRVGMTTILRLTPKRQNVNLADYRIERISELPDLIHQIRGDSFSAAAVNSSAATALPST
jgi:putative hydrolase of the HAD superfamily